MLNSVLAQHLKTKLAFLKKVVHIKQVRFHLPISLQKMDG